MVALQVGDQVTLRPLSLKTIERQRRQQRQTDELEYPGRDVVIRAPFNFQGVVMTVEELHRDTAYCTVHDLRVRLNIMCGKSTVEMPRKYLKRFKKEPHGS